MTTAFLPPGTVPPTLPESGIPRARKAAGEATLRPGPRAMLGKALRAWLSGLPVLLGAFLVMPLALLLVQCVPHVVDYLLPRAVQMDRFSQAARDSIKLWVSIAALAVQALVLASIVASVLRFMLKRVSGRRTTAGAVRRAAFERCLPLVVYTVFAGIVVAAGTALLVVPGLVAALMLAYVPLYVTVRQHDPVRTSVRTARRWVPHTAVTTVLAAVAAVPGWFAARALVQLSAAMPYLSDGGLVIPPGFVHRLAATVPPELAFYLVVAVWGAAAAVVVRWDADLVHRARVDEQRAGAITSDVGHNSRRDSLTGVSPLTLPAPAAGSQLPHLG